MSWYVVDLDIFFNFFVVDSTGSTNCDCVLLSSYATQRELGRVLYENKATYLPQQRPQSKDRTQNPLQSDETAAHCHDNECVERMKTGFDADLQLLEGLSLSLSSCGGNLRAHINAKRPQESSSAGELELLTSAASQQ